MSSHQALRSHPANVPGDFYVENGCCTLCGVPQAIAPNLFSTPEQSSMAGHCYVRRQPANENELNQILDTIAGAELQCIRYAGTEHSIQSRIVATGDSAVCDNLLDDLKLPSPYLQAERGPSSDSEMFVGFRRPGLTERLKEKLWRFLGRSA
jgi:hypothetical protein